MKAVLRILPLFFAAIAALPLTAQEPGSRERPSRPGRGARPLPEGVKVIRDIAYVENGGPRRTLDLYLPKSGEKPLPLVVWVHGGAWQAGSKEQCRALPLLEHGFAVASINYRLSRDAAFPAQIQDCKAAVRFLRAKSAEYGIEAQRIGAWGSSAGGHLVALLGTAGDAKEWETGSHLDQSSRVQAVLNWFGPSNLATMGKQSGPDSRIDHDAPDSPESQLIGGPILENPEKAKAASPMTYVSADDPPFLHVHGDRDLVVPFGQSEEFHAGMRKAGVESALHVVKGGGHGTGFPAAEMNRMAAEFFAKHLKVE